MLDDADRTGYGVGRPKRESRRKAQSPPPRAESSSAICALSFSIFCGHESTQTRRTESLGYVRVSGGASGLRLVRQAEGAFRYIWIALGIVRCAPRCSQLAALGVACLVPVPVRHSDSVSRPAVPPPARP